MCRSSTSCVPSSTCPYRKRHEESGGNYRFERGVTHRATEGGPTKRRIDLYRRDRFILEAKQGANADRQTSLFGQDETQRRTNIRRSRFWAQSMVAAKGQAEAYVRDLPTDEASPPFLIVCDVGFCFDLYADFSGTGRHYAQYPDREGFRIYLPELRDPAKGSCCGASGTNRTL